MNDTDNKRKLANLAVRAGVNLQEGQDLFINSPIETASFARMLAEEAYAAGARDVQIFYSDEKASKLRYEHAAEEALEEVPESFKIRYQEILDKNGAVISIHAQDPNLLRGVDPARILKNVAAREEATREYSDAIMADKIRWNVLSVPTESWARTVFPDDENAVEKLWDAIYKTTYTDTDDPAQAWIKKDILFKKRADVLNQKQYRAFRYKNNKGTDLVVGMPQNYVFSGGSERAQDGISFFPNLPTEEIFSAPHKDKVDGTLASALPLVYQGQMIDSFTITFKDGRAVSFTAETGEEALANLLNSAEGSDQLGEIALVPYHSPISEMGLLFYNTLFDENASCHFALGAAYPNCLEGGEYLTPEELLDQGLNQSNVHVDFMIGTEDLEITGILPDGTEEPVFIRGDFAF